MVRKTMQKEGEEPMDMINQGQEDLKVEDKINIEGQKETKAKVVDEADIEGTEARNGDSFGLCFSENKICSDESAKELWSMALSKFKVLNTKLVKEAANFVFRVHKGRVIDHLIAAATRLANSFNWDIIVASGLLQDSLCDSETRYEDLEKNFGREVADLVTDVSKLTKLSEHLENSEHMLDLILAMVDPRAVVIKIAARTEQMTRLDAMSPEKKQRFANETLAVYVPLLERLNLNEWKAELQHLSFNGSDELKKLYANVSGNDEGGKAFKDKLEKALHDEHLAYIRVESRKKSLHSIQNKMSGKNIAFSEVTDIIGLRIILNTVEECYKAQGVVEKLWRVEQKEDYIQNPYPNGYSSLHLTVKNAIEVQIRTEEMHWVAERFHWAYKEGKLKVPEHVKNLVEWARWINKWASEVTVVEGQTARPCKANPPLHHRKCPYAKMDEPLCLAPADGYKFPGKMPVYVIVIANNKWAIEEHPSGTVLKDLFLRRSWNRLVLINEQDGDLSYRLKVGDKIQFA